MRNISKQLTRFVSLFVASALIFPSLSTVAFAQDESTNQQQSQQSAAGVQETPQRVGIEQDRTNEFCTTY